MGDDTRPLELQVMQREYEWLIGEEVMKVLLDLRTIILHVLRNFCLHPDQVQGSQVKPEKFLLSCSSGIQQSKCMVTLVGDVISEADVGVRLPKQPVIIYQTRIYPEMPWKLQQIQDAGNRLQFALSSIDAAMSSSFTTGTQVLSVLDDVIDNLKLGRECIYLPKLQTVDDFLKSPNKKVFKPLLPNDTLATFFIQAQKLVLAVYHLTTTAQNRVEVVSRYQLECYVPWLNDALLLFTLALHKCQQLRDKVAMFIHYDAKLNTHEASSGWKSREEKGKNVKTPDGQMEDGLIGTSSSSPAKTNATSANNVEMTCL